MLICSGSNTVRCALDAGCVSIDDCLTAWLQGIAKTGSGKTAAFVLPMIVHIMDQPEVEKGAGPIGVVVVPTRELAEQIHKETRKFSKPYQLRVAAAFGGLSKFEQFKDLKNGSEVCFMTPLMTDHAWFNGHPRCSCAILTQLCWWRVAQGLAVISMTAW